MTRPGTVVAIVGLVAGLAGLAGCSNSKSEEDRAREAMLTSDADFAGARGLNYEVTSEVFKKWKRAEGNLRRLGAGLARSVKSSILSGRPGRESMERAVAELEGNTRARRAVESAGLSPRQYVVATIALYQAMGGADPLTGERFQGVPRQNIQLAEEHRSDFDSAELSADFQAIADSIEAARAAREADADTSGRGEALPVPLPTLPPPPTPVEPQRDTSQRRDSTSAR